MEMSRSSCDLEVEVQAESALSAANQQQRSSADAAGSRWGHRLLPSCTYSESRFFFPLSMKCCDPRDSLNANDLFAANRLS